MKFIYAESEVEKEALKSTCLSNTSEGIPGLQGCANVSCKMQHEQEKGEHSSELLGQPGSSQKAASDQQHITSSLSLLLVWECWCKAPEGVEVHSLLRSHTLIKTRCHCQPSNLYLRSLNEIPSLLPDQNVQRMHWKAAKQARGVKGCPPLSPPGASHPGHHQNLNIQLQQWPSPVAAESGNASWTWSAGSRQAGAQHFPSFPGKFCLDQHHLWQKQFQHHLRQWGKEMKNSVSLLHFIDWKGKDFQEKLFLHPWIPPSRSIFCLFLPQKTFYSLISFGMAIQ